MSKKISLLLLPSFGCLCALATALVGTRTSQSASLPVLTVTSPRVTEGTSNGTNAPNHADFVLSLQNLAGASPATIHYATVAGTAAATTDFTPTSGDVTLSPGQSTTVSVPLVGDSMNEDIETFKLSVTATGATPSTSQATGTILDDDAPPAIRVADVSVNEGNSGNVSANFALSLSAPSGRTVTVSCATADGTALAGSDYTALTPTTFAFAPGQTTKTVSVLTKGDFLDEGNENFLLKLSNATNATIADGNGVGTIVDNDTSTITATAGAVKEGDSGTVPLPFTISLSTPSDRTVSLRVISANAPTSPATLRADYVGLPATTVTFAPGETQKTVNVNVNGDTLDEDNEYVGLSLSGASNATLGTTLVSGLIQDDDNPPALKVNDVAVVEGNSGTVSANFTISLSPASGRNVTVSYTTADGTATAGSDYTALAPTTITFTPNQKTAVVSVPVKGDTIDELNETFSLKLSNATNALLGDSTGNATIVDDDTSTVTATGASVVEGNSDTVSLPFTLSLSTPNDRTVSVKVLTANATTAPATAGSDYVVLPSTAVTFAPGETSKTVNVTVNGDTLDESDENVGLKVNTPVNATIGTPQVSGVIQDDDAAPTLSVNDISIVEGNGGQHTENFTVSLSAASGLPITVNYATSDGTASSSPPATDYDAIASTSLSFAPGQTSKTVAVTIKSDVTDELDETFNLLLSNPTNATIVDDTGVATILDDDTVSVSFSDAFVTEGDSGFTLLTFNGHLTNANGLDHAIHLTYATADVTATAGSDYTPINGTVTISPGNNFSFSTSVFADTLIEGDETLTLNLTSSDANVITPQVTGTIVDNDTPVSGKIAFSSTRAGSYQVYVMNADGTNQTALTTSNNNYSPRFNKDGTKIVFVSNRDFGATVIDKDEIYIMNADGSNPTRLTNNTTEDSSPSFSPDGTQIIFVSNRTGSSQLYTMKIDGTSQAALPRTVAGTDPSYSPDGTKIAYVVNDQIYIAEAHGFDPQRLTNNTAVDHSPSFSPDGTKIIFNTDRDGNHELYTMNIDGTNQTRLTNNTTFDASPTYSPDGTMIAYNSSPSNSNSNFDIYIIKTAGSAPRQLTTGTATDIDPSWAPGSVPLVVRLASTSASITEGNTGSKTVTFQAALSTVSSKDVSVDYTTQNVTATADSDYTTTSGTVTIPAGSLFANITIPVLGDTAVEGNENFHLVLSNPINAQLGTDSVGTATILDDDASALSGKIAFTSYRDGKQKIYVMNADGSNQTQLTNNSANDFEPKFSADGSKIVFSSDRDGNQEIYVMNADGSNQARLTNSSGNDASPAFSPDGSKIVFISQRDSNPEIYTMNADGTGVVRLTTTLPSPTDAYYEEHPGFSLDGSKIVYDLWNTNTVDIQIYIMNADGTGKTQLVNTANPRLNIHVIPSFSPSGNQVIFSSLGGTPMGINVVNSDGTGLNHVTSGFAAVFSPDNGWITFSDGNTANIYIAHQDGSGRTQLTTIGSNTSPSWAPGSVSASSSGSLTSLKKKKPSAPAS